MERNTRVMTIQQNLSARTVSELKAEAARVGCTGVSKLKKAELAQRLAEFLSQPKVIERLLMAIEETEFKQLKKALRTPMQPFALPSLERLGYASASKDGLAVLSKEMSGFSLSVLQKSFYDTRRQLMGLSRYLAAFTALYGIVELKTVKELLLRYEGTAPASLGEDIALLGTAVHSYYLKDDKVVAAGLPEAMIAGIAAQQAGKPRAALNKTEMLRFAEPGYCCRPAERADFCGFLQKRFRCTARQATELAEKVCGLMQLDSELLPVVNAAREMGLPMQELEDVRDFSEAFETLYRHYPLWIHCGHSVVEMEKLQKATAHGPVE